MKRKIILIILVFLFNIVWVNAISITNALASHYNIVIKVNNKTNLNSTPIMEELDFMLQTDLTYNEENAIIIGKKIEKFLNNEMDGKGELIAKYSVVNEVDPYLIAAILIEETNCDTKCSVLVTKCNNVYKAIYDKENISQLSCFGGSYQKFNSIDDSIKSFVKFIKNDFYDKELTTPSAIYKNYNRDVRWAFQVNGQIDKIKKANIE